jgi:RimJ/RimL family protein N-acetyltransferase
MGNVYTLETDRVLLRQWKAEDYGEFAKMNSDVDVMRHFPNLLTTEESHAVARKFENSITENSWGFWVAQRKSDNAFMGLVGLNQSDVLPLGSCVEVGWRLAKIYWGMGYATEAARASLYFAFSVLQETGIAAFTSVHNYPSRKVMRRLGMKDQQKNFLHPGVAEESGLREHVFYQIEREQFVKNNLKDSVPIVHS